MSLPVGVCVKAAALRPEYDNLSEFLADPDNALVCRRGRIWITAADGTKKMFKWVGSPFANPFPVGSGDGRYTLEVSLAKYRAHLERLLQDSATLRAFRRLAKKKKIGCFCNAGSPCHRDVIIDVLRTLHQ